MKDNHQDANGTGCGAQAEAALRAWDSRHRQLLEMGKVVIPMLDAFIRGLPDVNRLPFASPGFSGHGEHFLGRISA
jgi:hypothetical protein